MRISFQRILVPLFIFIWWNRLREDHPYFSGEYYRLHVVKVTDCQEWVLGSGIWGIFAEAAFP